MRRAAGVLLLVAGAVLVGFAILRHGVEAAPLLLGLGLAVAGMLLVPLPWPEDLMGDHPDELEERRRRGAAGWQKPVAPPRPGSRPGGLPPRRRDG